MLYWGMDMMEPHRIISVSLGKIALSKSQRGGLRLHKSLMVAGVLLNARSAASTSGSTPTKDISEIEENLSDPPAVDSNSPSFSNQPSAFVTVESDESSSRLSVDELSDACDIELSRRRDESMRDEETDVENSDDGIYDCERIAPSLSINQLVLNNGYISLNSSRSFEIDDEIDSDADISEQIGNTNHLQSSVCNSYQTDLDYIGLHVELSKPNKTSCDQTSADYSNYVWQNRVSTGFGGISKCSESEKWGSIHSNVNNNYRSGTPTSSLTSPATYLKRQRHCSESSDNEGDYDIRSSTSKRLRYDSETSYYGEYLDKCSCITPLPVNSESGPLEEGVDGSGPQLTNLVNCFSSGFSGLLCSAEPTNLTSSFSQDVMYSVEVTSPTDFCEGKKDETDDILSCSTQIREALETLSRPIIAMTV